VEQSVLWRPGSVRSEPARRSALVRDPRAGQIRAAFSAAVRRLALMVTTCIGASAWAD
jgi:hypothetical protein